MIPYIELNKGKKRFLLIRDRAFFHILDVDDALTEEKKRKVLEHCPSPELMLEMGLHGSTIAIGDLLILPVRTGAFGMEYGYYGDEK